MKGKILIAIGTALIVFGVLWFSGILPLSFVSSEAIKTCPFDGGSYQELKSVSAIVPKVFGGYKINKIVYLQDNAVTTSLTAIEQSSLWSAPVSNVSLGSHDFEFECHGFRVGDVNHDGVIDDEDKNLIIEAMDHSNPPKTGYIENTDADLNEDGKINSADLILWGKNVGQSTSTELLSSVSGTFTISLIGPDSSDEPKLSGSSARLYLYQLMLQFGLVTVGLVFVGLGWYIDKKEL